MHAVSLQAELRLSTFFAALPRAHSALLLLDYDGTLAPFAVERTQALPYAGVRDILDQIVALGRTRLVIVTGRAARSLQPLLGLRQPIEVWGSHGAERLQSDGRYFPAELSQEARSGLDTAWAWLAQHLGELHGERKPTAVALHWRGLPVGAVVALREQAELAWGELAQSGRLMLRPFDGGLELRATGFDKSRPVRALLAEAGPGAAAAYLGDDLTDEHAFAALRGHGLTILIRPEFRPTAAELWLRPPDELLAFLHRWHAAQQSL